VVDARGLRCPLPVLMTEKRLAVLPDGAALVVLATDVVARIDIPLYCRQNGHSCDIGEAEGAMRFAIVKGGAVVT
jgi:tRNA 2-thiouridine synthesizing protein A